MLTLINKKAPNGAFLLVKTSHQNGMSSSISLKFGAGFDAAAGRDGALPAFCRGASGALP